MVTMETQMCKLVMAGDRAGLNLLLNNNTETLAKFRLEGNSALHIAAGGGHEEIVSLLVTLMPCMLSWRNTYQETSLHTAARSGNSRVVNVLLNVQSGLQCNCNSSECPWNDLEASAVTDLEEIWRAGNYVKETALHYAVRGNYVEVVDELLEKGIGIESILNQWGESALYTACHYGCLEIGNKLLSVDLALTDTSSINVSCLHLAIDNILEWRYQGKETLQWHDSSLKLAFKLVRTRPHLAEVVESIGENSPLHLLVALPFPDEKHLDLVKELLLARPEMNFKFNKAGMAPIHLAAQHSNFKMIKCLLDNAPHCSYLLSKPAKKNALHLALEDDVGLSLVRKVHCLLQDPVDVAFLLNAPDSEGNTALSIADNRKSLIKPVKQYILERMWGTSPPGPNIFKKSKTEVSPEEEQEEEEEELLPAPRPRVRRSAIPHPIPRPPLVRSLIPTVPNEADVEGKKKGDVDGKKKGDVDGQKENDRLSVIAALVATITFAAAFTIPGGFDATKGSLVLWHKAALKTFILCDTLGLSLAMLSLLELIYSPSTGVYKLHYRMLTNISGRLALKNRVGSSQNFEQKFVRWGSRYLFWSLNATMVTFATGLYVVLAPKHLWLAITVCIITFSGIVLESILPIIYFMWTDIWYEDWWVFYAAQAIALKYIWIG